uniref:Rho GTPase-activating protein 26 n=1 Tax=Plectus sambesii TaxID=2011161 RepID=A0A914VZW4_9BILA
MASVEQYQITAAAVLNLLLERGALTVRKMVLKPLEFSDCLSDSPWFRQNLHGHEYVLDTAYKNIKNIETQCRELIAAAKKLSATQRAFAKTLREFKLESVGTTQTDDERVIANCLKEFAKLITQVEDQRDRILEEAEVLYIEPLKKFRCERIGRALHEDKKKFDKSSAKFYQSLEKHLHLSTARKNDFREADATLEMEQRHFYQASLDYVFVLQSVQERMKFEFVETLSSFLYSWLSFYHVGHVIHEDFKPFLDGVQVKVQKTKQGFDATQQEAEELKARMLNNPSESATTSSSIKQGYVLLQEKSKMPKTIGRDAWTKYYCVYQKETRIFTMIPVTSSTKQDMKGTLGQSISFKLKACIRRASDSIDKRFCFDLSSDDRADIITVQALSEEDRRQWLDAMDGREPVYSPGAGPPRQSFDTALDDHGFEFITSCLKTIEEKGLREQGLYRNCGVTSKVQKLLQIGLDRRMSEKLNLYDDKEWEIRTISSTVKTFLRNLPEPLMTFELHSHFINAAKMDDQMERIGHIHYYVYKLPQNHFKMLELVIKHLKSVADLSSANLMTVGNLGVCFGPTLLRPKEETMAAIIDIKFCNVVVEVLIANCDRIFGSKPSNVIGLPCPPKPAHNVPVGSSIVTGSTPSLSTLSPILHTERSHSNSLATPNPRQFLNATAVRARPVAIYERAGATSASAEDDHHNVPTSSHHHQLPHLRTNDSSDSLNSVGSGKTNSESSPSPNRSQGSAASTGGGGGGGGSGSSKARMSVSYAPPYTGDL